MTTSRLRSFAFAVISIFGPVLLVLASAELVLRFLPVEMSVRTLPLDAAHPVLRAPPNTRFSHSVGWHFQNPNSGRINNDGFFNEQDYHRNGPRPLIVVVGDSYIEAKMVPYPETIQGRLAADLTGSGRVYSFAMSGAPLSQYLAWIGYAREPTRPTPSSSRSSATTSTKATSRTRSASDSITTPRTRTASCSCA